jgi:putative flippase GtrA
MSRLSNLIARAFELATFGEVAAKFLAVTVLGAIIDVSVTLALQAALEPPLALTAAGGVLAGAVFNYFAHEYWTFGRGGRFSFRRASAFFGTVMVTLLLRMAVVSVLASIFIQRVSDTILLLAAFGVSFVVSFLLARFVVFRKRDRDPSVLGA